jgi:hypothetical protein
MNEAQSSRPTLRDDSGAESYSLSVVDAVLTHAPEPRETPGTITRTSSLLSAENYEVECLPCSESEALDQNIPEETHPDVPETNDAIESVWGVSLKKHQKSKKSKRAITRGRADEGTSWEENSVA